MAKRERVSGEDTLWRSISSRSAVASHLLRACLTLLPWALSLSHPEPCIEFRNSERSPHILQTPSLVGPLGLSIIQ